jgi:hypothetical protein
MLMPSAELEISTCSPALQQLAGFLARNILSFPYVFMVSNTQFEAIGRVSIKMSGRIHTPFMWWNSGGT